MDYSNKNQRPYQSKQGLQWLQHNAATTPWLLPLEFPLSQD
jgi:hypothetical protein